MKPPLCTSQPPAECQDCSLNTHLMCRYDKRDTLHFLMIFLPFGVTAIGGVIYSGLGWWLLGWLAYALFFFFVWEARVLCSHCPYWAEEGRVLRCHANYGVIKLWKYNPEPMSRFEGIQFLAGAALLVLIPVVLLVVGGAFLLAAIALASGISFGYLLWHNICNRCVNFSCPLNHVDEGTRQMFLVRNPVMKAAWDASKTDQES